MDSKKLAKLYASTRAMTFFSYQDRSSEEAIRINNRLSITTGNWSTVKEQFIEERFAQRRYEAWNMAEWARNEKELLNTINFDEWPDRKVLKERYSRELSNIINGRIKSSEQRLSFKWIGGEPQLKELFKALKSKYIESTWKDFQSLFRAQEIKNINPIQWKESAWELYFLIDELATHLKLVENSRINNKIVDCFINCNGEPFKAVKQQKSQAKQGVAGSHEKQKVLVEILEKVRQAR